MLATGPTTGRVTQSRHRWTVFAVLSALMAMDYVDRQIVASMFPHLKAQFNLTDAQLGALVSIVGLMVAIGTVPLSFIADRVGRARSIFVMAMVWSGATIACAFVDRYTHLLAARAIVGAGEAAYGTVGVALLAGMFPSRMRSTIFGAFLVASIVGAVVGVAAGGIIAERWGWQHAFGVAGVPGMLLALIFVLLVKDPERADEESQPWGAALRAALKPPRTLIAACIGGGLQLMIVATVLAWMPAYLNRFYGMTVQTAGVCAAFIVLMSGAGTVLCGVLADRMTARTTRARLLVPTAVALASGVVFFVAFGWVRPGALQLAMIVLGATIMAGSVGPLAAVAIDVSVPTLRATNASLLALTQNLFGLAAGPLFAGILSDRYGLASSLCIVSVCSLFAAALFIVAARSYDDDMSRIALRSAIGESAKLPG